MGALDCGRCLPPCWLCFQAPRLVLAGAPLPLHSRTGSSPHLPHAVDSDQRKNNWIRLSVNSPREHPDGEGMQLPAIPVGHPLKPAPRSALEAGFVPQHKGSCADPRQPPARAGGHRETRAALGSGPKPASRRGAARKPGGGSSPCPRPGALSPAFGYGQGRVPTPGGAGLTSARTARAASTSSASFMQYTTAAALRTARGDAQRGKRGSGPGIARPPAPPRGATWALPPPAAAAAAARPSGGAPPPARPPPPPSRPGGTAAAARPPPSPRAGRGGAAPGSGEAQGSPRRRQPSSEGRRCRWGNSPPPLLSPLLRQTVSGGEQQHNPQPPTDTQVTTEPGAEGGGPRPSIL